MRLMEFEVVDSDINDVIESFEDHFLMEMHTVAIGYNEVWHLESLAANTKTELR